ncbi:unnamed protein product [Scytosiphon promiscuus]
MSTMKGKPSPHLMAIESNAGQSCRWEGVDTRRGLAWTDAFARPHRRRLNRWAPMGLSVAASDHVEGFVPVTVSRKRPQQLPATRRRLKLLPSQSPSCEITAHDRDPIARQHANDPGVGKYCCSDGRESDHHRQKVFGSGGSGVVDNHGLIRFGRCEGHTAEHSVNPSNPSLEILTRGSRGAGNNPEVSKRTPTRTSNPGARSTHGEEVAGASETAQNQDASVAPTTAESRVGECIDFGAEAGIDRESRGTNVTGTTGKRHLMEDKPYARGGYKSKKYGHEDGSVGMRKDRMGEKEGAEDAGTKENEKPWKQEREDECLTAETGKVLQMEENCGKDMQDDGKEGGEPAKSTTKKHPRRTRKTAKTFEMESCDIVMPIAFPGEAHENVFGGAARAVVLASGSSRFMVSRYVHGKILLSRVGLPWRPPLRPPWRTSNAGGLDERSPGFSSREIQLQRSQQQAQHELPKQLWELHRAAIEIQRAWRGYLARVEFWTDGGAGLHAVATRVQRIFRGWRGKVRAAKLLVGKRERAATMITALGRGYQGRQEAKRSRVDRLNLTAAKIQNHFRSRAARRWRAQLALAANMRCAGHIQAVWRGFSARMRFRVLGLRHSMEEEVLEAICLGYRGRKGWAEIEGSACPKLTSKASFVPILPESFKMQVVRCGGVARAESVFGSAFYPALPPTRCQPHFVKPSRHRSTEGGVDVPLQRKACSPTASVRSGESGCRLAPISDAGNADVGNADVGNEATIRAARGAAEESDRATTEARLASSDRYFVAYGHCLLAGAGTGVWDEASERRAENDGFDGTARSSRGGGFLDAATAARISDNQRTRGYGDALEVFQEGLRRFPTSTALLYGSSFAMQASWFTDGRGASPTAAMLEASLCLLLQAWAQDPGRRVYQQVEEYFLAAARIARRRLLRAEAAAAAGREATLAAARLSQKCNGRADDCNNARLRDRPLRTHAGDNEDSRDERQCLWDGDNMEVRLLPCECIWEDSANLVSPHGKRAPSTFTHVAPYRRFPPGKHHRACVKSQADTSAAYRRVTRLYLKAGELDTAFALPEIGASERVFAALYRVKPRLLATRLLLLKLPPHPDPTSPERREGDGSSPWTAEGRVDAIAALAEVQRSQHQLQQDREREEQQQRRQGRQEQQAREQQRERQQRQREQEEEQASKIELQRQQHQLVESTLTGTSLGTTSGTRGPKRPHVARRIASRVVTAVREGTKIILQTSTRHVLKSHRAAGLTITAATGFRDSKRAGDVSLAGNLRAEGISVPSEARPVDNPAYGLTQSPANGPTDTLMNGTVDSASVVYPRHKRQDQQDREQQHDREPHHRLVRVSAVTTEGSEQAECTLRTGFRREVLAWRQTPEDFPETNEQSHSPPSPPIESDLPKAAIKEDLTAVETGPAPKKKSVPANVAPLRATVTAWRCGAKLILRVNERDAVREGTAVSDGRLGGDDAVAGGNKVRRTPSVNTTNYVGCPGSLLGNNGSVIVVHEAEMERLIVAAVEQQVADGRPRDVVEAEEPFRLVSEHFMGKVTLQPECDHDHRYRFSTSRKIGSRKGGFVVGLGRFSAGLPYLDVMRDQQAELSARDDGARVLQRAFGGLLTRSKCRSVCYELLQAMEEIREQGRRLLEEDVLRQRESDAARQIQGAWKGWKLRVRLAQLKSAAKLVRRCFRRLEAKRAAEKAERTRLEGPEVLTVFHKGTVVSGVPLMLSVSRCGYSFKFVGRDQGACWAHHGYCYEFEVVKILHQHNRRCAGGHKGDNFVKGRVGPIDQSRHKKVVEMLVSRLALVDALPAPTAELRGQHRYKTLVVQTPDIPFVTDTDNIPMPHTGEGTEAALEPIGGDVITQRGLRGPGILAVGAEHGRGLRDTRALVSKSYSRYLKRQAKWEESRRKQAYMRHSENKTAVTHE